jgi:hypothetical protein
LDTVTFVNSSSISCTFEISDTVRQYEADMDFSNCTKLFFLTLISCSPGPEKSVNSVPVVDEEEEPGPTVEGTIEYLHTGEDGITLCDASIGFTGTSYTGDCEGCDYSFKVNAEVVEERSGSRCEDLRHGSIWTLSLIPDREGGQKEMLFGFSRSYEEEAENVIWSGYIGEPYDSPFYGYGGFSDTGGFNPSGEREAWEPIAWDWSEEYADYYGYYDYYDYGGSGTLVDGVISWTAYANDGHNTYAWFFDYDCDFEDEDVFDNMAVDDAPATSFIGNGELPCPESGSGSNDDEIEVGHLKTLPTPIRPSKADSIGSAVLDTVSDLFTYMMSWASPAGPSADTGGWGDQGDTGWWDDGGYSYRHNELVDVWTIDLNARDEVLVTIDTLDGESGFDPGIIVTGPESCPLVGSDDSFNCTAGETDWAACPGVEFMADTDGTYHLIIQTVECGDSDEVTYQIGVDAPREPNLSLIENDVMPYEALTERHEVIGTATITMPE